MPTPMSAALVSESDETASNAGAKAAPRFGPFHRLESPTQTAETAALQVRSQAVWGKARARGRSDIPQVQAYTGALPPGRRGIEFYTDVKIDRGCAPGRARWSHALKEKGRDDVRVEGAFAKIPVVVTKNTQGPST